MELDEDALYGDLDANIPDAPGDTAGEPGVNNNADALSNDDDEDDSDDDDDNNNGFGIVLNGQTPQETAQTYDAPNEDEQLEAENEEGDDEEDEEDDGGFSIVMANAPPKHSLSSSKAQEKQTNFQRNASHHQTSTSSRPRKPPVPPLQLDDGTWLTYNGHAPLARYDANGRRMLPGGMGGSRYIPPDQYKEFLSLGHGGILDLDLDNTDQAPWRTPGADISDFFNYGFTEDTWKEFQADVRRERLKRFHTYVDSNGQQPTDLAAAFPVHNIRAREAEPRTRALSERIKPVSQIEVLFDPLQEAEEQDKQEQQQQQGQAELKESAAEASTHSLSTETLHGEGSLVQAMETVSRELHGKKPLR